MGLLFFDRWACDLLQELATSTACIYISQPARGYEVLDIVIPGNGALGPELLACSSSNTPGNLRKSRLPTTAFFSERMYCRRRRVDHSVLFDPELDDGKCLCSISPAMEEKLVSPGRCTEIFGCKSQRT